MLNEIIDLQNRAVSKLVELTKTQDTITFKAPTGSGKTYMMADYMDRILAENPNIVFMVSTLSKGELAKQNYDKFCEYVTAEKFLNLKPYLITSDASEEAGVFIPLNYNVYVLPHALLKDNSLIGRGPFAKFLYNITLSTQFGGLGKQFYLVKDEAHIKTTNLDKMSEDLFVKKLFMTATPDTKKVKIDCEITENEAVNAKLIKSVEYFEPEPKESNLEKAIAKFKQIKEQYTELIKGYNPCLIIQISNDYKDNKKAEDEINLLIKPLLNKYGLKWMTLVEDGKSGYDAYDRLKIAGLPKEKWKEYVKQDDSPYDVVIFKMVVSEGYDIPRACMLFQVRNITSSTLSQQVIGRVRRVPKLTSFETLSKEAQELATKAYVWSTPEVNSSISVKLDEVNNEIQDEIKIRTTVLKLLKNKNIFDVEQFLESKESSIKPSNIFALYKSLKKCSTDIITECYNYSTTYDKWWKFNENLNDIKTKINSNICNYAESMALSTKEDGSEKVVTFAPLSRFLSTDKDVSISNWVWVRNDGKKSFSFDSIAEKEWAEFLNSLRDESITPVVKYVIVGKKNPKAGQIDIDGNIQTEKINHKEKYLWGKNFLPNSEIKFEYYLDGVHSSYPDFIMKDSYGRIHIFEVKSMNESKSIMGINSDDYTDKVKELIKCYTQASKLTNQIFYIPIKQDKSWELLVFRDGKRDSWTQSQFLDFVTENKDF